MSGRARRALKNFGYAAAVQVVALLLSLTLSLVVPKMLGVVAFGYWQLFVFYSSYVGFFHLGMCDGVYLRVGGVPFREMDYKELGAELRTMLLGLLIVSLVGSGCALLWVGDVNRRYVIVTTALVMIIMNVNTFMGSVFQAGNVVRWYSTSLLVNSGIFLALISGAVLARLSDFRYIILMYGAAQICRLVYSLVKGRKILPFLKPNIFQVKTLTVVGRDVGIGLKLMLANIADLLIVGTGRFFVDHAWGIAEFGQYSFAISLSSLVIMFFSQVSMVLFPELRQLSAESRKRVYRTIRDVLGVLLPAAYLLYLPTQVFVGHWLPNYEMSLTYFGLLLPICVFNGKMNLLYKTYMKVLRRERALLTINVWVFLGNGILCAASVFWLHSVTLVIISSVVAVTVRSVVTEIYLSRILDSPVGLTLWAECVLSLVFVVSVWLCPASIAFLIFATCYGVYLLASRGVLRGAVGSMSQIIGRR